MHSATKGYAVVMQSTRRVHAHSFAGHSRCVEANGLTAEEGFSPVSLGLGEQKASRQSC